MRRSLTINYIAASFKSYSALTATPIATLLRHILGGPDIGSIARIHIRRETLIAWRGGPIPHAAQTAGDRTQHGTRGALQP